LLNRKNVKLQEEKKEKALRLKALVIKNESEKEYCQIGCWMNFSLRKHFILTLRATK
jgi:hypothetical protein